MKTMNACTVVCWILSLLAAPVLAEPAKDELAAPEVSSSLPWVGVGLALLFAAGVAVVAFKNANRSRSD